MAKTPMTAERRHLAAVRRIYGVAQAIIVQGLQPLMDVWPGGIDPDLGISGSRDLLRRRARSDQTDLSPGPLVSAPRAPRISRMSDEQLRRMWPGIDPMDVREYAPWATSRHEVARLSVPAGSPIEGVDLEARVLAAIRVARDAAEQIPRPDIVPPTPGRPPGAFRARRMRLRQQPPPAIYTAQGIPIPPPPRPTEITSATITRQIDWVRLALGEVITEQSISPLLEGTGEAISRSTAREMERALGIDVRRDFPGMAGMIDDWRAFNVSLIRTGIMGDDQATRVRPSMIEDISALVEDLHSRGIRVEELAGEIQARFGVGDSRAELIARDQTLKLNGQITHHRQRVAGITQYRWITSRDERVRDTHRDLDGTLQSWDSPPEVAPGRYEHPGGDYQCRCTAQPVPPEWMD